MQNNMTTTRSRNKMERRAHMNIHDTIEVVESETTEPNTRDRFGKSHRVAAGSSQNEA